MRRKQNCKSFCRDQKFIYIYAYEFFLKDFKFFIFIACVCICVLVQTWKSENHMGVGSLLPPRGFWVLNPGHQLWQLSSCCLCHWTISVIPRSDFLTAISEGGKCWGWVSEFLRGNDIFYVAPKTKWGSERDSYRQTYLLLPVLLGTGVETLAMTIVKGKK